MIELVFSMPASHFWDESSLMRGSELVQGSNVLGYAYPRLIPLLNSMLSSLCASVYIIAVALRKSVVTVALQAWIFCFHVQTSLRQATWQQHFHS
jgi:hypothetical protein